MSNKKTNCKCKYCGMDFDNGYSKANHERGCNKGPQTFYKDHSVWNSGLTKDTDERVKRNAINSAAGRQKQIDSGTWFVWNKGLSKETDKRVQKNTESMKKTKNTEEWKKLSGERIREKYNGLHFTQTKEYHEKRKLLHRKKYGVDFPMQRSEVFLKSKHSAFSKKKFKFPSGKEILYQGYENFAIEDLIYNNINEEDIDLSFHGNIWITGTDNQKHRYFPDIYVKSLNLFIEVKSDYTASINKEANELKHIACIENGFNHEFWIVYPNIKILKLESLNEFKRK